MTTPRLTHAKGCPGRRTETTEYPHVTTKRCVDCGAHWPPPPTTTGPFATAGADHDLMRATP